MNEVMKETNDLRDTIRFFSKAIELEYGYATVMANRPEFIKIENFKMIPQNWQEGYYFCVSDTCKRPLQTKKAGFIVVGYEKSQDRYLVAFQCNDCKMIQVSYNKRIDSEMKDE